MGFNNLKMNYIEKSITRRMTAFSKCRATIFKKANALARLRNVEVAVLINPPAGRRYMFRSPGFNSRFQNSYPRRSEQSSSSLKKASILKLQAKLDRLMKEMEGEKERKKVLKKRPKETLKNNNMKEMRNPTLEEFIAFKEKLETLRDNLKRKHMEMEALPFSLLKLSRNKKMN